MAAENSEVVIASYVGKGNQPTAAHFRFQPCALPPLQPGEIRLQTLFLSVDPYMRGRLNPGKKKKKE